MVENDKENYLAVSGGAGPVVALAVMNNRFESMPGNIPTKIPALSLDPFRIPYTGWYKVHFSCPSARQEVVTSNPAQITGGDASSVMILDGYHFVVACRHSRKVSVGGTYDPITGASSFNVQESADEGNVGKIVARSAFVRSGISMPTAATGFIWLQKGEIFEWNVYTYIANNNYDLMGTDLRQYGRIIVNDIQPSDERMGFGSPRIYSFGGTGANPYGTTDDSVAKKQVISSLSTSSSNAARKTYLMVQFVGTGGLPDRRYATNIEDSLNYDKEPEILASGYEV
jgi:hypothetical protein